VAYTSNESGRQEVYLSPFPAAPEKYQVSTQGGGAPLWRADAREIFYRAPGGLVMSVPVSTSDSSPNPGVPRLLFQYPAGADAPFEVTPDGERFILPGG
jgi:hypothetical protein